MKRLALEEATGSLGDYVREAKHEPVIVTAEGNPIAALIAIEGMDWESLSLSTNPEFLAIIEQSRARYKEEGGIFSEDIRRELGLNK
jgi:prevent-host-death family protein